MKFREYLKDSIVMNTSTYLLQNVVLATVEYINKMDLDEVDKQKLITYIKDDVYVRKMNPQDIGAYVNDTMQKLGM